MVFFCKQKTAYEMRISDWSSDVCSSDLLPLAGRSQSLCREKGPYRHRDARRAARDADSGLRRQFPLGCIQRPRSSTGYSTCLLSRMLRFRITPGRTDEGGGGEKCMMTWRNWWHEYHKKKKKNKETI